VPCRLLSCQYRAREHAQAFTRIFDGLARFNRSEARLLLRAIFHLSGVEREDFDSPPDFLTRW